MLDSLMRRLEYSFKDEKLLKKALTHRSAQGENNERLEFLGDAVVNLIIAEALYQQFPKAQEGELSRLRATLVNRDTLGLLARDFEVGRCLFLGAGELKTGGSERASILSCTMEAIIGAVYLDSGYDSVKASVLHWYESLLSTLPAASSLKDPKTRLQEFLQAEGRLLPVYSVTATEGEVHQQLFTVTCTVATHVVSAQGSSRRRAEQGAATKMLEKLAHE